MAWIFKIEKGGNMANKEWMDEIRRFCVSVGIYEVGFGHSRPFFDVEKLLAADLETGVGLPPFTEERIEFRVFPERTMKHCRSFITILEPYEVPVYSPAEFVGSGNISPAALGTDYHINVMDKLKKLKNYLDQTFPQSMNMAFVDNSPFSEKHVAVRCGLGEIYKNGLFYSNIFGSRCFIGIILTDIQFVDEAPAKIQTGCLECQRCINACPTKAITPEGFNSYRCISYLTQKKGEINSDLQKAMGIQIYGCDICQAVCPANPPVKDGAKTGAAVDLVWLLSMSNRQFKERFGGTAAGWRGRRVLQRNAKIALENIKKG